MTTARNLQFKSINYTGLARGPRLIITGAVHGNETCGTRAIHQLMEELDSGLLAITRGTLTLVPVTNPLAYQLGQRSGERNLNRDMREKPLTAGYEDRIGNRLCALLRAHDMLLDIHSFTREGPPFVFFGPEDNTGALEPFRHAQAETAFAAWTTSATLGRASFSRLAA